jgi:hypothetical protein
LKGRQIKRQCSAQARLIQKLANKLDERDNVYAAEGKILITRTEHIESTIGRRVTYSLDETQVPTVWASLAVLGGRLDEALAKLTTALDSKTPNTKAVNDLELLINCTKKEIEKSMVDLNGKIATVQNGLSRTKSAKNQAIDGNILLLARGASIMKDEIADLRTQAFRANSPTLFSLESLRSSVRSIQTDLVEVTTRLDYLGEEFFRASSTLPTPGPSLNELRDMFATLATRVNKLVTDSDNEAVKLFSLGFRDYKECETWVGVHLEGCPYGMIVDAHLVLEHIYEQVSDTEGGVKMHQGLRKADLDDLTQSLMITSFDSRIPKYFASSGSAAPSIRKANASYFDRFPAYRDWDEPITGFRDRLKE